MSRRLSIDKLIEFIHADVGRLAKYSGRGVATEEPDEEEEVERYEPIALIADYYIFKNSYSIACSAVKTWLQDTAPKGLLGVKTKADVDGVWVTWFVVKEK